MLLAKQAGEKGPTNINKHTAAKQAAGKGPTNINKQTVTFLA